MSDSKLMHRTESSGRGFGDDRTRKCAEDAKQSAVSSRADTDMQTNDCQVEGVSQELLPGIPDEVTFGQIVPKLPWRAFHRLSCVSRSWLRAIRAHQVHDARVRTHSAEELVLVTHICQGNYDDPSPSKGCEENEIGITLYSMRDNMYSQLPLIPGLQRRIPPLCQSIALDGKAYVLGGKGLSNLPSNKVYVMDLAGQRQWKECASMKEPRMEFGCGVINGKIYVFGGRSSPGSRGDPIYGSEMYNPTKNIWSPITPMPSLRYSQCVAPIGEELFLHGGRCYHPDFASKRSMSQCETCRADSLEIYHPVKNEWRVVKPFGRRSEEAGGHSGCSSEALFAAQGRLYSISQLGILVNVGVGNSWTNLQPISSLEVPVIGLVGREEFFGKYCLSPILRFADGGQMLVYSVQAANDEVLVLLFYYSQNPHVSRCCLLQSRGFSDPNQEIVWHRSALAVSYAMSQSTMCLIEL